MRLPDVAAESRGFVPQPAGGVASYEPRMDNVGREISSAGREIQEAAAIVADTNNRQDAVVAQAAADSLAQARMAQEFDAKTGFRNAKQGQAVGKPFVDAYTQRWDEAVSSAAQSLQNDNQRRMFKRHADVQGLQFKSSLLQHQAVETERFNDATDDNTVKTALREISTRPLNELDFQMGLTKINGTIDSMAQRRGIPKEQADALKQTYLDAAYNTRITTIANGIPGVVDSNPYLAEKMFRQVQSQLGPVSQVQLASQVQAAIKQVQQRDLAAALINGATVLDAKAMQPAVEGPPLAGVIQDLESKGRRYDASGNLLTSPAGAQGEMQVMPGTAKSPGFGVAPARDDSPEELARVGRDYVGAMTARYQDPALVLAAYNAGPGQVDKWIAQYGDPRTGQISKQEWVNKIPFAETRAYVTKGLSKVSTEEALIASVTGAEMKTKLPALVKQAQDLWARMYPNDPMGADAAGARVAAYGNQIIAGVQAQQQAAFDGVMRLLVGGATSIDDITSTAEGRAAWSNLTPEGQYTLQQRLKKADGKLDEEGFRNYYALLGQAGNDPSAFTSVDLSKHFGAMPDSLLLQLAGVQKSINLKDVAQQQKELSWGRAKAAVSDMLTASGLDIRAKPDTEKAKVVEQFYGRYQEAIQQYHDANGKWPGDPEVRKIASGLLTQGAQRGGWLWDSKELFFKSKDPGQFYVPLPPARSTEYAKLAEAFRKAMGRNPKGTELEDFYTRYKLAGGK